MAYLFRDLKKLGWFFMGGKRVTNFVKGGANFSVSTTNHVITCPTGKRWLVIGGRVKRDVSATLGNIEIKDESDNILNHLLTAQGAATNQVSFPLHVTAVDAGAQSLWVPYVMVAGDYVDFTFSVAQGVAAEISLVVLEVDVS